MRGNMCSTSINATAARLLDRNARLWGRVVSSWTGIAALWLLAFAALAYGSAFRIVVMFACLGGGVFQTQMAVDPALQAYSGTLSALPASVYVLLAPLVLFVGVGGLSLVAAMITLDSRKERAA